MRVIEYKPKTQIYKDAITASKALNNLFGDYSGRTVSTRTSQGFKKIFKSKLSTSDSVDVVHAGMIASTYLVTRSNKTEKIAGCLLALGLLALYQEGK